MPAASPPDHYQLAAVDADLEAARVRLARLVAALPADRWNQRAEPDRWSPAECVAHLNLTSQAMNPLIRAALAGAGPGDRDVKRRYRQDFTGWLVTAFSQPVSRWSPMRFVRIKTIPAFVPSGDLPSAALAAEFGRLNDETAALLRSAVGLSLDDLKVQSPFDVRARYNVYSAFVLIPRHQHRHLQQAERVWAGP